MIKFTYLEKLFKYIIHHIWDQIYSYYHIFESNLFMYFEKLITYTFYHILELNLLLILYFGIKFTFIIKKLFMCIFFNRKVQINVKITHFLK